MLRDRFIVYQVDANPVLPPTDAVANIAVSAFYGAPDTKRNVMYQTQANYVGPQIIDDATVSVNNITVPSRRTVMYQAQSTHVSSAALAAAETITMDKWASNWATKPPQKALLPGQQQDDAFTRLTTDLYTTDKMGWFGRLSEPVRRKVFLIEGARTQNQVPITGAAETVTVDKWFNWLSEPRDKVKKPVAWQNPFTHVNVTYDEETQMAWFTPLSEPIVKRSQPTTHHLATAFTRLTTDTYATPMMAWFAWLSEPMRRKVESMMGVFGYYPFGVELDDPVIYPPPDCRVLDVDGDDILEVRC